MNNNFIICWDFPYKEEKNRNAFFLSDSSVLRAGGVQSEIQKKVRGEDNEDVLRIQLPMS